ncbi:MAG: hypothetical protein ACR2H5_15145 [Ktedonobacteraceae bacterium]
MTLTTRKDATQNIFDVNTIYDVMFPGSGLLESREQIRRFELLRLAFFALKLRKMGQRLSSEQVKVERAMVQQDDEQEFRRNLLRHVIFQQVLTLIHLDAREQALQIIEACQK